MQAASLKSMSSQYTDIRKQLESDEQLKILMAGLRGSNLNDSDYAEEGVTMSLVEVCEKQRDDADDCLPLVYDPAKIAEFWARRPVAVATRIVQLLSIAGGFLSGFLWDLANGKLAETEVKRAIQLRNIVTSLGPAYIKLGQALSIRPDILSPAAMNELQKLCDKVPSYNNDDAMQVICDELGAPWYEVYAELSPRPIAAASLGQVYKGKLKTGETVAVKVQRPGVLETVSIDLFVIRRIGVFLRRFPEIKTDVPALIDEWASRFFEELDYVKEGQNATRFAESIREDLPQVVVPRTYTEYTRRRVLTSQWIDGEKLSQSKADDVASLVNVGVVCYLKQLLDTGFFMADPHPGNLIRTPDARLAILDFGLMTYIDDNIKYGMIEAISHLIHRDYEAIVQDFVTLDFIPKGTDLSPILPVLAKVFDQALEGGGAKNINFQELAADLAQITFDYPFRIPPYFALIIRAISVLEGVALVANPDFAIVDEAYPYVAKKLLTDQSPRLQAALQYMIYGKENKFNAARLIDLLGAYETFREAHCSTGAREALKLLLSPEGKFFREFITNEVVLSIDAMSRTQLVSLVERLGLSGIRLPVLLPGAANSWVPLSPHLTEEDRRAVDNVAIVVEFLVGSRTDSSETMQQVAPLLPEVAAQMLPGIISRLTSRIAARTLRELYMLPS
ncbi:ABC1-domain-containing protein [Coccomyxa subellipsoidea C-169]|uniref:ABC1-domain-containing protein n=1 Tax=Coccomyxa subellipsoidea (strain C-169) TaxID=574566 RepID=I0YPJ6_COCSC|nr:ABC1-domain-containing protein [Coccomyxa subellipsoidea C-169]EIE20315.1 ABC1-domain-containing protein [Coccomyxa subellipsoidea C-169]|eukprot:XP_005644859.1 ABC1-domain-containing protein [Coccomyxa subellipsoidea C-169]